MKAMMLVVLFLLLLFGKSPSDASRVSSLPCSQLHFLQLKCFCELSQLLSAALAAFWFTIVRSARMPRSD